MIRSLRVYNEFGEALDLTLRNPEESGFLVMNVGGLGPSKATVSLTQVATINGGIFNSSRITNRNITFNLLFINDDQYGSPKRSIEDVRQLLYRYFPVSKKITIEIIADNREAMVEGFVESNDPNVFSSQEGSSISVVCPDAYLYALTNGITGFSYYEGAFEFPFSNESLTEKVIEIGRLFINNQKFINYTGDASVGVKIYVHANGPVENLQIRNVTTGESMTIDHTKLSAICPGGIIDGDDIVISTVRGSKYIFLTRNGVTYNIINSLGFRVVWPQLIKGLNHVVYTASFGVSYLYFVLEYQIAYEGI